MEEKNTEQTNIKEKEAIEALEKEVKPDLSLTQTIVMQKNAPIDIEKEEENTDFKTDVENLRLGLMGHYKKNKRLSNIMMVAAFAFLATSIILIVQKNQACTIAGYIVAGVALVGMIVFYALTKNQFPNETKKYIQDVTLMIDRHTFNNQEFTNMQFYREQKEDKADIIADRVYKDVADIGSRNIVKGLYKKHCFRTSELATYKTGVKNKKELTFLGKYVSTTNDLHFEGRIILSRTNPLKPSDIPTDIDDLSADETNGYKVYTQEGSADFKSILGSKFMSAFEKLELNKFLLNINIVIWAGKTAAYLSYEDAVVALPFDKPFEPEACETFTSDLKEILKLFELLRK